MNSERDSGRWLVRFFRRAARILLGLAGIFLAGRALVEPFSVDPFRSQTYRRDWGGPHYLGVIAVHSGPGLIIVISWVLRRRRSRTSDPVAEAVPAGL